jgi:ketosteroid isomerase-like protein
MRAALTALALTAAMAGMPALAQIAPTANGAPGTREAAEASDLIMAGMADSAEGWNTGNLDRFLAIYSDAPEVSFTTSKGVAWGKAGIRARYLTSYPAQFGPARSAAGASRLSFDRENFRMLGDGHALLIARWTLVTAGKAEADTGLTSLVFRKEAAGWRIVADHSS